MSRPTGAGDRAAILAALPRMPAPFPLQVMGELGLNHGEVRWMDRRQALIWCPEWLPEERTMRARIDLRKGIGVDVDVQVAIGQTPASVGRGYLHVVDWSCLPAVRPEIEARLRTACPTAFDRDYQPPSLPQPEGSAGEARRRLTAEEQLAADHAERMHAIGGETRRIHKGRVRRAIIALATGSILGFLGLSISENGGTARLLAFRSDPAQAARAGLLRGANFSGEEFPPLDLTGVDMREANLVGADLHAGRLQSARLAGADLRRADLSGADLRGASLVSATLEGASFRMTDLRGADLTTNLTDVDFDGAVFSGETRWSNGTPAPGAIGPSADLRGRRLTGLKFEGLDAPGINLAGATLEGAELRAARLQQAVLTAARTPGALLIEADLALATAEGWECPACGLATTVLDRIDASDANLADADLTGSSADQPVFRAAHFERAKLVSTRWQGADLRGAVLTSADLNGARWPDCLLLGADLRATSLGVADLTGCILDANTRLPDDTILVNLGAALMAPGGNANGARVPQGLDLSSYTLDRLQAQRAQLDAVVFNEAALDGANLSNSSAVGTQFIKARLARANLSAADLRDARFAGADLSGANFAQARLCGADFVGADLTGARFAGAQACASTRWSQNRPPKGLVFR